MPVFSKRSFSTAMAIAAYVGQHVPHAQVPDGLILTMKALGWRRLALDLGWRGTENFSRWNRNLVQQEVYRDRCPNSEFAFHVDASLHELGELSHDGQAQTRTFEAACE